MKVFVICFCILMLLQNSALICFKEVSRYEINLTTAITASIAASSNTHAAKSNISLESLCFLTWNQFPNAISPAD